MSAEILFAGYAPSGSCCDRLCSWRIPTHSTMQKPSSIAEDDIVKGSTLKPG
ncbi:MAG: hypothetical protein OXG60_15275 [Chloroflexi bacterium]|nr:hypothetical protein [Chloroflexota bacterium]